jgi:hypothetical protein
MKAYASLRFHLLFQVTRKRITLQLEAQKKR